MFHRISNARFLLFRSKSIYGADDGVILGTSLGTELGTSLGIALGPSILYRY
jgi:hypothetical protein